MPIIIELPVEFDARHTKDGPKLADLDTQCELFPDGAMRDRQGNQHEPPSEPGDLLRAKRKYIALKLKLEVSAFEHFQNECKEMLANKARYANTLPGPAPNAKEQLECGAKRIKKLRDELAAMDREISNLPDEVARRKYLEQQRANQQSAREQLSNIAGMTT